MTTNLREAAANISNLHMAHKNGTSMINGHSLSGAQASPHKTVTGDKVGSAPEAVTTGASYFFKQDYMADLAKKCASKDFTQVSKLLGNLGPADKSTNWLLEQRTLNRAQASEGREIRELIDNKVSLNFKIPNSDYRSSTNSNMSGRKRTLPKPSLGPSTCSQKRAALSH